MKTLNKDVNALTNYKLSALPETVKYNRVPSNGSTFTSAQDSNQVNRPRKSYIAACSKSNHMRQLARFQKERTCEKAKSCGILRTICRHFVLAREEVYPVSCRARFEHVFEVTAGPNHGEPRAGLSRAPGQGGEKNEACDAGRAASGGRRHLCRGFTSRTSQSTDGW